MTTSRSPRAITASGRVVLGGGEPGIVLGTGAGVPLQGPQAAVAGLRHEKDGRHAVLGQVGERGVPKVVQRGPAAGLCESSAARR